MTPFTPKERLVGASNLVLNTLRLASIANRDEKGPLYVNLSLLN
jgi:hypothetical protein